MVGVGPYGMGGGPIVGTPGRVIVSFELFFTFVIVIPLGIGISTFFCTFSSTTIISLSSTSELFLELSLPVS